MARRFSIPTCAIRPGSSYLTTSPPPQRFSIAQVSGASTVTVLFCTSTTTRSRSMLKGCQRPPGESVFMPTASIHAWLPMRRTITVSPGLKPRADVTLKLRPPTGTYSSSTVCLVSSRGTAPAAPAMRMSVAGPPPKPRPPRPGPPPRPATSPGPPPRPPPGRPAGLREPGRAPGGTVGRDGRPARAGADEDGPGVAHPFAAQHDAAGVDRHGRRHPVVAGPEQHRAAEAVPVERQRGHLVDRALDVRRVIPRDRPDRFLDRDRGNGHSAPSIPGMRGVVNDVALVVRNVDQLAVGARIDA